MTKAKAEEGGVLDSPIFTIASSSGRRQTVSLPELFKALDAGEVDHFPLLRAHQSALWHMFLCQMGAAAVWMTDVTFVWPGSVAGWRSALLNLTDGDEAPWRFFAKEGEVAFLQPAFKDLAKGIARSPDEADILLSSKNHDIKRNVLPADDLELWFYALATLQTGAGYSGAGYYGAARQNGGASSRVLMGLAPMKRGGEPDASAWWRRDVRRLLQLREEGAFDKWGEHGGPVALWALPWGDGAELKSEALDPWFIDVSRRIRLVPQNGGFVARFATTKGPRVEPAPGGILGDPWAPVFRGRQDKKGKIAPKVLTLGEGSFNYIRLSEILFGPEWDPPLMAIPGPDDQDCVLICEALRRGMVKTFGYDRRVIPIPRQDLLWLKGEISAPFFEDLMEMAELFGKAVRTGLAVAASGGGADTLVPFFGEASEGMAEYRARVDKVFFGLVWRMFRAAGEDHSVTTADAVALDLMKIAIEVFERHSPRVLCQRSRRAAGGVAALDAFLGTIQKKFPELHSVYLTDQEADLDISRLGMEAT